MVTFDSTPTLYWLLGYLLAGIVIISAVYKIIPAKVFFILSILLLVFMRMPVLVFNREINADESQMLSHAITLYEDPVYWRSVDGTTIGPLDNYLLVVPKLFGFQINYTSGRVMGLLCTIGALLFVFLAMRNWFGETLSRIAIVTPVIFLAFTQETDFVHYSSEQLPVFLLATIIWLLSKITESKSLSSASTFTLGLVAGMMPFAKLQSVPQAMVIVLAAIWICYHFFQKTKQIKPLLFLLSGGLAFPVLLFIWAAANHVFGDFIDFYLLGNAIYAGENNWLSIPVQMFNLITLSPDFKIYSLVLIVPIILGIVYAFLPNSRKKSQTQFVLPATLILSVLAGIYAATKSGNTFIHYLNFCIYPWILLAAYGTSKRYNWFTVFSVLLLFWFVGNDAINYRREHRLNSFESIGGANKLAENPVVKELKKFTKPGDYMTVWGWQCQYYVEAQLAQGTAENHSERSIFKHPLQEKYLSRYLSDLNRTKPVVILDAVGKNSLWVQDKKTQGIENFPALANFVHQHYTLVSDKNDIKLFVRKDRLTTQQQADVLPYLAAINR
ncbi:hypothetical protein ACFP1I_26155 [Dyadobacter subterraneus]|uniref:Glycosyltransferase RgtA/B/C/D-like domain-containing protein n=1 Tax=Dyadobacter subterraneus TaxID=2773304 RepID=A0ABR9WJY2_9BACT|nr:hypothetical protein [Dyadobacter subterraneus]MBE9465737.1 hypothetical protein [Dyadobacter subterraneus]